MFTLIKTTFLLTEQYAETGMRFWHAGFSENSIIFYRYGVFFQKLHVELFPLPEGFAAE